MGLGLLMRVVLRRWSKVSGDLLQGGGGREREYLRKGSPVAIVNRTHNCRNRLINRCKRRRQMHPAFVLTGDKCPIHTNSVGHGIVLHSQEEKQTRVPKSNISPTLPIVPSIRYNQQWMRRITLPHRELNSKEAYFALNLQLDMKCIRFMHSEYSSRWFNFCKFF